MHERKIDFLVGDNAFHGISHLSQQRARDRLTNENPSDLQNAAKLVRISLDNGAAGFMFSVSETTLSVLKSVRDKKPALYAIVPYAYEYVRLATKAGGLSGLAKNLAKEIVFSRNITSVWPSIVGLIRNDPSGFLKTYLMYEISRVKSAAGKDANLKSVLLHEVVTDMALSLNLDWLFKSYVAFLAKHKISPGFETRNFPYLVKKLNEWNIDTNNLTITASFNKLGFQMNPSQLECEKALKQVGNANIVAMSILAAGYLKPFEAADYISKLPNISQIVVGVSKEKQAYETFAFLKKQLIN